MVLIKKYIRNIPSVFGQEIFWIFTKIDRKIYIAKNIPTIGNNIAKEVYTTIFQMADVPISFKRKIFFVRYIERNCTRRIPKKTIIQNKINKAIRESKK